MDERLIKSGDRVKDHGEVYTPEHIVKDMLDLVKEESYRLESKFLEPSAGNGNFLVEILRRKLETAKGLGLESLDRNTFIAVASIYAIDILSDNVKQAKDRMIEIVRKEYENNGLELSLKLDKTIQYVLDKNIIWGDTLKGTKQDTGDDIEVVDWIMDGDLVTRKVYDFRYLNNPMIGDIPLREYEPIKFIELGSQDDERASRRKKRNRRGFDLINEL